MGGMSISGLTSGLDTASIINQLMQLERQPQNRLQTRKTDIQNTIKSFQELNAKFQAIRDAADALTGSLDWRVRSASSSDESVVTTEVTGTPVNGTLSFTVTSLAAAHSLISGTTVAGTSAIVADGTDFTVNGTTITAAEYGGGSLAEVVDAINASNAGVAATAVQVSTGNYRLQLTSETTGDASVFTVGGTGLTAGLGSFGIVTTGSSAAITVGSGPGAYEVRSDTNTFADVIGGLNFTAKSLGSATVTVESDGDAIADKVEALVTAMNEASKYILDRSKYNQSSKDAGVFLGTSMPGNLRNNLFDAFIDPVSGSSLVSSSVGISTDRHGAISFDRAKFLDAYGSDPAAVEAFFGKNDLVDTTDDGIAERISLMAESATALNTGQIASAISGRESEVTQLDSRIADWDVRLELRETALRRQFTNLETMLGRLQSQGQWLAGQLASLPRPSSS